MAKDAGYHANHLKDEMSPYLKQHAMNPVDWYPWTSEALQKAKEENKPIILSIGYSTCHWCHVMERESFEDSETAKIMNENFINIKVDREERPDLDSLYMKAVQAMTGHAGWPLTVFATPEGVPFYGGSYFPPEDRYGLPSFKKVLLAVSLAFKKNKQKIEIVKNDVEQALSAKAVEHIKLDPEISSNAYDAARLFFDPINGGFGRGTKFPHAMFLKFLLKFYKRTGQNDALSMIKKTLSSMAAGGIYDHLGGGFHRYSVDEKWEVPHFEKMLYDNALLAGLYAMVYEQTGKKFYKDIAVETLEYILRDLKSDEGGFYSAQDADVEGKEGVFYLWDSDEIKRILGEEGAAKFVALFSVTEEGNYEGRNLLRTKSTAKAANDEVSPGMKEMKEKLLDERRKRPAPDTDHKIITAWNGLAISALSEASQYLKNGQFIEEAKKCARFLLSSVKDEEGRLLRYYLEDGKTSVKGNLEDYALLAGGLLSIYEATGEETWLNEAKGLTESMIELFYDDSEQLFYDTGTDQDKLFVRERDLFDNDVPSGNSAAADLLLRMYKAIGKDEYRELSEGILSSVEGIKDEPLTYGNFLTVLESFLGEEEKKTH